MSRWVPEYLRIAVSVVYCELFVKLDSTWNVVDEPSAGGTASAWTVLASGAAAAPLLRTAAATSRSRRRRTPSSCRCMRERSGEAPALNGGACREALMMRLADDPGTPAVSVKL